MFFFLFAPDVNFACYEENLSVLLNFFSKILYLTDKRSKSDILSKTADLHSRLFLIFFAPCYIALCAQIARLIRVPCALHVLTASELATPGSPTRSVSGELR